MAGRKFAKDTRFMVYPLAVHWNEKNYTNAREFHPERFLNDDKRHAFSFIPFGAGPRNCIGQKFALQEATILLALLVQNFKIVVPNPERMKCRVRITQVAEDLYVKFVPRTVA